jgi:hypothetical protein
MLRAHGRTAPVRPLWGSPDLVTDATGRPGADVLHPVARLTAPYRSGPSRDWIKVKNPDSPAMIRHREGRWGK